MIYYYTADNYAAILCIHFITLCNIKMSLIFVGYKLNFIETTLVIVLSQVVDGNT